MMKKNVLFLLLLIGSFAVKAQLPSTLASKLQDTLAYFSHQYKVKGLSTAVSYKTYDIWRSAVGRSTNSEALTPDKLIGIGSNTKTFLSALILKLYENGQLQLTDTVGTWITGYPNINGAITIRQLLNHTSGVAEYLDNPLYDSLNSHPNKSWTRAQLLDLIGTPDFAPGTSFSYSNSGYIIAGGIVEAITGKPIQELFRDSIFALAGLAHTFYPPLEQVTGTYAGFWTDMDGNGTLELASNWNTTGSVLPVNINTIAREAGGLVATASDVVSFWRNLLKGNIISKSTLNSKMMEWSGFGNTNSEYGLGLFLENYKGTHVFHHGGTWIGQINSNINDTLNDIYVAVLSNQDSLDNEFTEKVAKVLYDILYNYNPLSIDETINEMPVTIFPNPTSDYITIEFPENTVATQLVIKSLDGKIIASIPDAANGQTKYKVTNLNSGTYLVSFQINGVTYYKSFVKM